MNDFIVQREAPPTGVAAICGPKLDSPLPVLSWWFGLEAQRRTEEIIANFDSPGARSSNFKILNCIGLWFWTLESGISVACKILKLLKVREESLPSRLVEKFELLPKLLDSKERPSERQINELRNFCTFRNKFFHDLYDPNVDTQYKHSRFSRVPAYANELDLVEAMRISISCLNYYRYIISGVDLIVGTAKGDYLDAFDQEIAVRFSAGLVRRNFIPIEIKSPDRSSCKVQTAEIYRPVIKL